jgi:hypothetical protein
VNNELEIVWKLAAMASFRDLHRHLSTEPDETMDATKYSQENWFQGRDIKQGYPKKEAALPTVILHFRFKFVITHFLI